MHLCQLINIDVEKCVYVAQMEEIKKRRKKKEFSCVCAKIIDLFLGDLHLSSIGDGRGVPVGCVFQIAEEKNREKTRHFALLPTTNIRRSDDETTMTS